MGRATSRTEIQVLSSDNLLVTLKYDFQVPISTRKKDWWGFNSIHLVLIGDSYAFNLLVRRLETI